VIGASIGKPGGALLLALVAGGCAHKPSVPLTCELTPPSAPSGAMFAVRMDQPLDTRTAAPGECFTATVERSLDSETGEVVAPVGARLSGRIARVERGARSSVTVELDAIDTVWGPARLSARFVDAGAWGYVEPPTIEPGYQESAAPYSVVYSWWSGPFAFGSGAGGRPVQHALDLPRGATVTVRLTAPLVAHP
jgi:hypothetical protein